MSRSLIDKYSFIYRQLSDRELDGDCFYGFLSVKEKEIEDALRHLHQENLTTGSYEVFVGGNSVGGVNIEKIETKHKADDVTLKVDLSKKRIGSDYVICEDWNELLSYEEKIETPVDSLFFTGNETKLTSDESNQKFESYKTVGKLFSLIRELALETSGKADTIFYGRPLFFDFKLKEEDIEKPVDIQAIEKIHSKDMHKEAITFLICSELVSCLKDKDADKRFSYLVQHISSFVANVLLSYQGYVDNYNFEKVRKEYLEKKTEYIIKIYNVFDAIGIKLLSIPAGIWFATNQITEAGLRDPGLYKNFIVLVTVFFLVSILILHCSGQFSVLKSLRKEYTDLFDSLKLQFPNESDNIISVKFDLNSAEFKVELKLWSAIIASVVMFIMTAVLFFISFK